jgi:putative Mg2+ transporter-C (MgtC) family protein
LFDFSQFNEVMLKLLLALVLGGIVGFEREYKSRPAGLRTHILVCIGAALVQITAVDYYYKFHGTFNVDPMRLGAQVISGIGFLGAGTILKEGTSIKGLTTAASIWVVACIGLAVGTGLYMEAIIATLFIYFALRSLKKIEQYIARGRKCMYMQVIADNTPGKLGLIGSCLGTMGVDITNVEMHNGEDRLVIIDFTLKTTHNHTCESIMDKIMSLEGVKEAKFL